MVYFFYVNHRESETSQIRLLTLFAKIKFSRKFPNLQYHFSLKLFLMMLPNYVLSGACKYISNYQNECAPIYNIRIF